MTWKKLRDYYVIHSLEWNLTPKKSTCGDQVFGTFSCGILGPVRYLIVLIPDLCHLSYFYWVCDKNMIIKVSVFDITYYWSGCVKLLICRIAVNPQIMGYDGSWSSQSVHIDQTALLSHLIFTY